jgi:chorismate synthase
VSTGESATAHHQRSDVCAVPAAGVVAEAMVALVLADAALEKLGGDSMQELLAHWAATQRLQADWPHRFGER